MARKLYTLDNRIIKLVVSPAFDKASEYSNLMADDFCAYLKSRRHPFVRLDKSKATILNLKKALDENPIVVTFFYDHGNTDVLYGQGGTRMITPDNAGLFKGGILSTVACLSADTLGPSVISKGGKTFLGYTETLGFTVSDSKIDEGFTDSFNSANKALSDNKTAKEAYEATRKEYNDAITKWNGSADPQKFIVISTLAHDLKSWVLQGSESVRIDELA